MTPREFTAAEKEEEPIRRLDITVMMGGATGASRKRAMLIGNEKVHAPACRSCHKTWPEVDHFLISGALTMCKPCWKAALEVK